MIVFPNAKINLGLDIIEKRKDGYHNISSCFYPVPLSDALELIETREFSFSGTGLSISGKTGENLVVKAWQQFSKDFNLPPVSIHLHKVIPLEGGLGGGSSDAAFTLKALSRMFELYLDEAILTDYALSVGSDCPFFIYNRPMVAGERGDKLEAIEPLLEGYHVVIVKPCLSISTSEAYKKVIPLIPEISIREILTQHPVDEWRHFLKNDFEGSLFSQYPELAEIKKTLYRQGALYASMTGSGSAFYGIFDEKPEKSDFPDHYFRWTGKL